MEFLIYAGSPALREAPGGGARLCPPMGIIDVRGISKTFRIPSVRRETVREHVLDLFRPRGSDLLRVLDGVSFGVERGETLGIMGRNGSGKSTLLKIVAGIYPPDAGSVEVHASVTPILELGVGWNPHLDAIDNILLIGTVMGMRLSEARASIDEILAFAELERFANLPLRHFSSGMASRLAYSVAFRAATDVLILDEIFAVGDAGFRERCQERYMELSARGTTVVLVTHDARIASVYCRRALLLERGRIVMDDSGERVAAAYLEMLQRAGEPAGPAPAAAPS